MANLDNQKALDVYRKLIEIRCVENTIANRYAEQEMRCPTHLSGGQEGVPAVLSVLLNQNDFAGIKIYFFIVFLMCHKTRSIQCFIYYQKSQPPYFSVEYSLYSS